MFSVADRLKLFGLRVSQRFAKATNFVVDRPSGAHPIRIPITGGKGAHLIGPVDRDLAATVRAVLAFRQGPVLDVGANVGLFLLALLEVDRDTPYVAFEPDIACCEYLEALIRANALRSHHVFPVALSDSRGVLTLQTNSTADVSATVMVGFRPANMYDSRKHVVALVGDDVVGPIFNPDTSRIALIKIDVEGAENAVLRGLRGTIQQHRPFLILEISPYQHFLEGDLDESYFGHVSKDEALEIATWRKQFIMEIDEFLAQSGFRAMKIHEDGTLSPVASVDPGAQKSFRELNYLAVPDECWADFNARPTTG